MIHSIKVCLLLVTLFIGSIQFDIIVAEEHSSDQSPALTSGLRENSDDGDTALIDSAVEALGRLPLSFVENQGQFDDRVAFFSRQGPLMVYFTRDGMALRLISDEQSSDKRAKGANVFLTFEGSSQDVRVEGCDPLPGKYNYLADKQSNNWHNKVPAYGSIRYRGLYQGIDMVVRDHDGRIEYDLILEPGADVDAISVRCQGGNALRPSQDDGLVLETDAGPLVQPKPYTYAVSPEGEHEQVSCTFRVLDDNRYGFHVPNRDCESKLVIDPGLIYSTVFGGVNFDQLNSMAIDSTDAVVITGYTISYDFPTTPGTFDPIGFNGEDVIVVKMSPDGSQLLWSTFLGSNREDKGHHLVIDDSDNVIITGLTRSPDFPVTAGAYDTTFNKGSEWQDAFVSKLSADGSTLLFSTFLGGSDIELGNAVALDDSGAVVVTGTTYSNDFPTTTGAYDTTLDGDRDAFVAKLSADASTLIYGTYLGGTDRDYGHDLGADASGAVVVAGETDSNDFPTTTGAFDTTFNGVSPWYWNDAFVAKLSADGSNLLYGTFLGGTKRDSSRAVAVDSSGVAVVTGYTSSLDFPTNPNAFDQSYNGDENDVFAVKLSADGSQLIYGTYVGGSDNETSYDVILDNTGAALITGPARSSDFPVSPGAYDTSHNGGLDVFLTKLSADGSELLYGTFLGASSTDWGYGLCLDSTGNVVLGGHTTSMWFPITYGVHYHRPTYDLYLTKLPLDLYELSSDTHTISESTGGAANFSLNAYSVNANRVYYILGSLSGTHPGMKLPLQKGNTLFLNWDAFTDIALSLVNTSFFQNFNGTLDSQGQATAVFQLPAGSGLPIGLTFYFAFITIYHPWDVASQVVEIEIVP